MYSRSFWVLLAGAAFILGGSPPATAIEPDAAAKALAAALVKGSNVEATFDAAELDGDDIVIENFVVARTSGDDKVTFAKVVITSPVEGEADVFHSPEISFTGGTVAGTDLNGTIAAATMTGVTVLDAAKSTNSELGGSIVYETADATGMRFTHGDQQGAATVDRAYVESGNILDGIAQDSAGSVEGIVIPNDLFPENGFRPETFGYDQLRIDVSWETSRDIAAGTLTIDDITVSIADGGDLAMSGVIGNLPDPRSLNDAGAASDVAKTKVHELTIRYDDHSLAGRILDFFAQRQGLERAEYAKQLTDALPFFLIALKNPAFQEQVIGAATGFLANPQSLTIEIAPDNPVSGDDIMALAKSEPGTIPDRLKASVAANTPE